MVRPGVPALACMLLLLATPAAQAQYFGKNKVLHEQLDFQVMETEHFRIYHYPPGSPSAEYTARIAERWYHRLSGFFGHEFEERKILVIYQDHADFQQTLLVPELIGESTGGFTEALLHRVALPLTGINAENDHVIGHELVHVFQFDIAARASASGQASRMGQLPLWLIEGLAEYLSQGRHDPATAIWLRDAVLHDRLPDPGKWLQQQPSPYHYGQAIWAYVAGRWGDDALRDLFFRAMTEGLDQALKETLSQERKQFFEEFHSTLRAAYGPVMASRQAGTDLGPPLLSRETARATVNLAPALSPDGRWLAFLSSRELQLELFLADAATGRVERKLLSADTDPHFDNLSFLDSSVAWSPDSRRFAFGVFAGGERRIAIYDMERRGIERRLDLPGIKGMRHPAWSPDGRFLAFSAVSEGASDLYLLELATSRLTRLTQDRYTAIQPAFSPDGRKLVFVTDRGPHTDLSTMSFGDLQLALLDLDTREIRVLSIFDTGKHIDPHFCGEQSLCFIAEPDGVPDVFRYELTSGRIERLTALKTGVSGITAVSPALSVTADGTMAVSVLENGGWSIYRLPWTTAAESVVIPQTVDAGTLPPIDAADEDSTVQRYLASPASGLVPADMSYPITDYRPRIRLTNVGPAAIGVATSSLGTEFGGALSLYFSDVLNRHQIVTTFQGGSTQGVLGLDEALAAEVAYLNQTRRLQWGARVLHLPDVAGVTFVSREPVDIDGRTVPATVIDQLFEVMQTNELSLLAHYPLSVRSRIEADVGISHLSFSRKVQRLVYPDGYIGGFTDEFDLPSPASLDLQRASLAFVHDSSLFGYVSPVRGQRLRVETGWTTGDLDFQTVLVDYRRYFFGPPLTFATRLVHFGRYGSDAEDTRLSALTVGSPLLVRGYELSSFDLSECTPTPGLETCPEYDRLIGSRIAVANLELRVPLLGTEEFGLFEFPAAPTELALFVDAGAAWSSGQSVKLRFERDSAERIPVFSAGIALRSTVLGALPIEIYYAHPFQRPRKDSVFRFWIGVGW